MTRALPPIVAALLAAVPAAALAAPNLTAAYAANPYTLAASCDLSQPLVFVNLEVRNIGTSPSAPVALDATDDTGVLHGAAVLPAVGAGGSVLSLRVPLSAVAPSPAGVGGAHRITVASGNQKMTPLLVQMPATLCAPIPATPAPAGVATVAQGRDSVSQRSRLNGVILATSKPASSQVTLAHPVVINAVLKLGTPNNLRAVQGGVDCGAHVGPIGALVCPDMIKSGDLLLVWDWQAGPGPDDIDGFRVYRVDGGLKQLLYTRANKKELTLVDLAKPAGGYAGKCYAVAAYLGARESDPSPAFCAAGGSVAKTTVFQPVHVRSSHKYRDKTGVFTGSFVTSPSEYPLHVGFKYTSEERLLGDNVHNGLHRAGVAFDVSGLRDHRLVSAKLRMTIASSQGQGNNHSCATDVGTGNEFWWQNSAWLEGQFGWNIAPTDTGPVIAADVTPLVASWMRGEPNYGFVLRNGDENINAFTNKQCETGFTRPVLEITYY
jgi:hypothetical protein